MARNTWLSNFGKSVKFGAIEAAKDLNPAIKKLHEDNQEFMSNISQTLSDIHRGQTTMSEALAKSSPELGRTLEAISQVGQRTTNDLKHFLKTGNMTGGRQAAKVPTGGGDSEITSTDMGDFDFGDDEFDFSDLPSPEEAMGVAKGVDSAQASVAAKVGASQIEAANKTTQATLAASKATAASIANVSSNLKAQTGVIAKGFEANAKMAAQVSAASIMAFQSVGTKLSSQLTMINDNLANIISFNNDTNMKYTMAAMSYFDQSLEQLKLIAGATTRLAPEDSQNNENQTDYERVFGAGGFDLSSYMGTIKSNLQKTELGPLIGFLENPEMLVQALENPIQTVTTQLIKSAVPQVMKGAMDELNKSVEYFFPALLAKMAGLGNDPNQNILVQTIGKIFGVEAPSARPNLGAYNKGAVPFDGITHKTINQVIPTYLSKILATLTGGEERMFNHDTGTFETLSDIRARHKMENQTMRDSALGSFGTRLSDSSKHLVFENDNEARIFREAIEGFKDAVVNSGGFVNWNNEDQMFDLMRQVNVQGMTEGMRAAMQDWIAYQARMMPKHEQMRASTAAYDYALQKQRAMKYGASRGDYSSWYANSNFTDLDSQADTRRANRLLGGGGYGPASGTGTGPRPSGGGGGGRYTAPFIRDQYEQERIVHSSKDNPNYGKEVGSGRASFDDLMAGGAKFAMDIQKEYLDNLKRKTAGPIKNGKPEDLGLRSDKIVDEADLLDDGYFPEETRARKRAKMSTMEKVKSAAYTKPAGILASAINSVNETLYRVLFGAGPDEESVIQILIGNINSVFTKVKDWVVNDLYHPLKRFLFGDDFRKTNFYQFFSGLFKRSSDVIRGKQDSNGNWSDGMMSDVMNEFGDAGKAIRNVITGKGYKDSHGVDHPENKDSVMGNISRAFKSVFTTLKNYLLGGKKEEQPDWQKEFLDSVNGGRFTRVKNKILDTVNGNKAAGGRLRRAGTYILSKGEKVISGNLAAGTVGETGAYDLDAGDIVLPSKDISKGRLEEGNFFAGVLQKTYGKVTDKLDQVIEAIHGTTKAVEEGGGPGSGPGSRAHTVARINQLIGDINSNSGVQKKKPFIDVIFDKVSNSLSQFAGVIGGSRNFDNKYIQKEYAAAIRKKAPKAIAHGALGGLGLGLATLAGSGSSAFGSYGLLSFFLPGGFIGSAILGLGLGILHQNESFMTMMYGKKGIDGERVGGLIPKTVQNFFKKNKTGILGGAMMGGIYGLTGFSIPGLIASLIPGGSVAGAGLGAISTLGIGLMGPVLFGSAMGLALKSKGMQKFLFGTGNEKDGKKATGVLNGKMAQKVKQMFPNAAVGAGLGWLTGGVLSNMGILSTFALGPYSSALIGGAIGIGMASDRFKEAMFGKYDEKNKRFVSGGLVDTMKEAVKLEILRPLSVFGQKSLAKMEHFIATDIVYPIAKAVMPYKVLATKIFTGITNKLQDIMTGVGNGITSVFNTILKPIRWLAKKAWDWTWGASKSLLNGIFSVAGSIISLPFKALGLTGSMITAYEKMTGGEFKEDLKAARQKADDYYKVHEEDFKLRMKDLDEEEKQYKYERKQARKSGYALSEAKLQEKTDQYHEELRYAEEQQRQAEAVAAQRREIAESQREELKELLREANLKLEGFTEEGKAILTGRKTKQRITTDTGELVPVLTPAYSSAGIATNPISAGRKRAIQKGIATSATPALGIAGAPIGSIEAVTAGPVSEATVTTLARSVDKLATNVGVENAETASVAGGNANIPPMAKPAGKYSPKGQATQISRGSGFKHPSHSLTLKTPTTSAAPMMNVPGVANQLQAAGIQRQDRMFDLVSQFYSMVEYKFDDMLGYNDIAANKDEDSLFRDAMTGLMMQLGRHVYDRVVSGDIQGLTNDARTVLTFPAKALQWAGRKIASVDDELDESDNPTIQERLRRGAGYVGDRLTGAGNSIINFADTILPIEENISTTLDDIFHQNEDIQKYLLGDQLDALNNIASILNDIKDNTSGGAGPIGGHQAAGGLIRKTGAYILSAGERVVRGARNTINDICRDAESEGSFFNGMRKRGNEAINQGMQAVASAIASLKGYLKDIAESTKDAANYARFQIGMLTGGAMNLGSRAISAAGDKISQIYGGLTYDNIKGSVAGFGGQVAGALGAGFGAAREGAGQLKESAAGALRDADRKVSSVFGGRTAEVIIKERQEAEYRQQILDALNRGERREIKNNDDTGSWWKSLLKFLPAAITTLAAPILAIATGIKTLYDWFTGSHGGYGSGANGSIAGMENARREVAAAGVRAVARAARTRAGRAIARVGGKALTKIGEGARSIAKGFKYGESAIREARFTNAERMAMKAEHGKLGEEIAQLESKGASMTRQEAELLASKKADQKVLQEAIEKEGREVDRLLAQSTGRNALEAEGKGLRSLAEAAEAEGQGVKSKLLKGLSQLMSTAGGAVEKVANTKCATKVVELIKTVIERVNKIPGVRLAKAAAKLTGKAGMALFGMIPGLGWLVNGAWAGIEGVLGWWDAAELLGVNPEHCTVGMKTSVAITNALMSLPYIMWLDVAIQLLDAVAGTEVKRWILVNVYKAIAGVFGEDGEDITAKQAQNQAEFEEFQKAEIKRLMEEEGLDEKAAAEKANQTASYRDFQKKKESEYHPYLDAIRKTDIGAALLGKNDENGKYQGGLFAKGKDWMDNQLAYLFGQNDKNGNYEKGLFSRLQDDIFGTTDSNGETKGGLYQTIHDSIFGYNDEEGKYQNGFFAQTKENFWNGVNNNIAYLFGVNKEDVDMLAEAKSKWIDNEMAYISNGIENNWKWLTDTANDKIDKAKKDLDWMWEGISGFADNNYKWFSGEAGKRFDKMKADFDWMVDGMSKSWNDFLESTGAKPLAAAIFGESDYWVTDPETGELVLKKGQKSIIGKALDWLEKDFLGHEEGEGLLDYLSRAFKDKVDALLVGMFGTPEQLTSLGKVTKWISEGLSGAVDDAVNWFRGGWAQVTDTVMSSAWNFLNRFGLAEQWSYRPGDYYKKFLASGGKAPGGLTNTQVAMADSFTGQGDGDFSQYDPRWAMAPYGVGSYAGSGCGPTVMASILSRMGKKVNPVELGTAAAGAGYKTGAGTNERFLPDVASAFGVKSSKLGNINDIIGSIRSGKEVVVGGMSGAGFGPFTQGGHYARVAGIDGGSAILSDPRGFNSRIGLDALARDTRTAYSFEGKGLGDIDFPDFSGAASQGNIFENFKEVTVEWLKAGGPLSPLFYLMKQKYEYIKTKFNEGFVKPFSDTATAVKSAFNNITEKFATMAKKVKDWAVDGLIGTALGKLIDFAKDKAGPVLGEVVSLVQNWWKEYGAKSFGLAGAGFGKGIPKNITPGKGTKQAEQTAFLNYMIDGGSGAGINFTQTDSDWANKNLLPGNNAYGTMKDIGCGPTALASSIVNAGGLVTPDMMNKLLSSSDVASFGNKGVLPKFFPKAMKAMGGEFYAINPNDERSVANAISSGASLIAGGMSSTNDGSRMFTRGGHYANIKGGFMKNGQMYVVGNDPLGRGRSVYRLSDVMQDIRSGGPNMIGVVSPTGAIPSGVRAVPMSSALYGGSGNYGEGDVWGKQHGGVRIDGAQPQTMEALQDLGTWFKGKTGKMLTLTSCVDGSSHNKGAHSHYNGWKLDVNDWGNGLSGGYLITDNNGKGSLANEFEAYGQSKGLGMNFENDHYDIAVDGTDWVHGKNYGGWKSGGATVNGAAVTPKFVGSVLCHGGGKRNATNGVVIHHMGSPNNQDIDLDAAAVHRMHRSRGWEGIGYHYVIRKDGNIERGRAEENIGAHAPHEHGRPSQLSNQDTVGINISGTFGPGNSPTKAQLKSAAELIAYLSKKYGFPLDRQHVIGHRDTTNTDCPGDTLYAMIPGIIEEAKKVTPGAAAGSSAVGGDGGRPMSFMEKLTKLFTTVGRDYASALMSGKEYTGSDINAIFSSGGNAGSTSASSGSIPGAITTGKNTEDAWNYFKKIGFSDAEVAGILANFQAESSMEPRKLEGGSILPEMDDIHSKRGYGLAQWTYYSRKQGLKDYAASKGASTGDMATQLEYTWKEAQNYGVVEAMHAAPQDPVTQAKIWMDMYEKPGIPHWENRKKYAQDFYNTYAGKGGSGFGTYLGSYMNSGLYGGGGKGTSFSDIFWGSQLGGIARSLGFQSPQDKAKIKAQQARLAAQQKAQAERDRKAKAAAVANVKMTPAEIAKACQLGEDSFDEFGNIKNYAIDPRFLNNGKEDLKTRYYNQRIQLQHYAKDHGISIMKSGRDVAKANAKAEANRLDAPSLKAAEAFVQKAHALTGGNLANMPASSINTNTQLKLAGSSSAVDTAIKSSGTQSGVISELRQLDIHREAGLMVQYLEIIARNQYEMAKIINGGGTGRGGAGVRDGNPNTMKPPTLPANHGFEHKADVSGKKDFSSIHSKNVEIAKGGSFKSS